MKLVCDTCNSAEACVLSLADHRPLCESCSANNKSSGSKKSGAKVALEQPKQPHQCDICQDAPAYCICVEERAVLCRDCDLSIHKSNKFTEKHCRFLFTGLKVGLEELSQEDSPTVGSKRKASGKGAMREPRGASGRTASPKGASGSTLMGNLASTSSGVTNFLPMQPSRLGQMSDGMMMGAHGMATGYPQMGDPTSLDSHTFISPASEFLGIPSLSENFTVKDVDAAYMADEFGQYAPIGVPEDVSHVLEVPDLDFGNFGMSYGQQQPGNWMDDGVVPEITY